MKNTNKWKMKFDTFNRNLKGRLLTIILANIPIFWAFGPMMIMDIYLESSPKIENQGQLEQLLSQEKKRLGIEDKKIKIQFGLEKGFHEDTSYSRQIGPNEYLIAIHQTQKKEIVLRHEVYHIADGHCDNGYLENIPKMSKEDIMIFKIKESFKYLFLEEPQADLYASFGWRL